MSVSLSTHPLLIPWTLDHHKYIPCTNGVNDAAAGRRIRLLQELGKQMVERKTWISDVMKQVSTLDFWYLVEVALFACFGLFQSRNTPALIEASQGRRRVESGMARRPFSSSRNHFHRNDTTSTVGTVTVSSATIRFDFWPPDSIRHYAGGEIVFVPYSIIRFNVMEALAPLFNHCTISSSTWLPCLPSF